MTPDELKHALSAATPFIEGCRQKWAALMVSTKPEDHAKRESYYAMICGLNAVEREWRAAANPAPVPEQHPDQALESGWNGLPLEKE